MPSGSIQAIPQDKDQSSGLVVISFQCHLVRFKLFRRNSGCRGRRGQEFQCHLVRFKLFRSHSCNFAPGRLLVSMPSGSIQAIPRGSSGVSSTEASSFNAIWFDSSYSAAELDALAERAERVSMPSGSIQAIPLM